MFVKLRFVREYYLPTAARGQEFARGVCVSQALKKSRAVLRLSHTRLRRLSPARNRKGGAGRSGNENGGSFQLKTGGTAVAIE
jgi:hypothetical protein